MKKLILLLILLPFVGLAQDKGTHFEHGLSWKQAKEKAKNENKYLFVDCFTTWCGPCKHMANTIFPQEKVGDFFNKNFVNIKVQFDKTKGDSEEVKSWYVDAEAIDKEFKIRAYPTFLIFSPQGELVHRIIGGGDADAIIARAQKALDPETQYYTQLKKYNVANPSPETLQKLVAFAEEANDDENVSKFTNDYLATQNDVYNKATLEFLSEHTKASKSKGFQLIMNEPEKVDAILGKGKANAILGAVIMKEDIFPELSSTNPNIDSVISAAQAKYPKVDFEERADFLRVRVYQNTKRWDKFQPAVLAYMKKYGTKAEPALLSFFALSVFENCKDSDCIASALAWSKRSVEESQEKEPSFLSTYAKLLNKLGKKDEAIAMQQKAVDLVPANKKTEYQEALDKMKKGS
jgi:thioredoxin-related protein